MVSNFEEKNFVYEFFFHRLNTDFIDETHDCHTKVTIKTSFYIGFTLYLIRYKPTKEPNTAICYDLCKSLDKKRRFLVKNVFF